MFNFQVVESMKKNGINVVRFQLKCMRYVAYIKQSEKEIADAFATFDPDYTMSEITRIERERHEYHDDAIKAVEELNKMAVDHGFEKPYEMPDYRRDYVTEFCVQYLEREAK